MTESNDILDLLDEAQSATAPSLDGLGQLSELAQKLVELEAEVLRQEDQLKKVKEAYRVLSEKDIPTMLDQLRLKKLVLSNGRTLDIKETFVGKIPEDRKPEAFEWLEKNGFGTLVKTEVSAAFGMGQLDRAKELEKQLSEAGYIVNASQGVAPPTLGKFVKTMLTEGKDIPHDLFTPTVLRRARIS